MALKPAQKKYLRGLTHHIHPLVTVADKGLTDNVMAEIEQTLDHHELVKIKLRGEREQRKLWMAEIEQRTGAERVHQIGQVACYFRRNAKNPVVALPS